MNLVGSLSKYFPPAKFSKPPHIGVSFSDTSIKAISFSGSVPKLDLKSFLIPLEKGAIVGGSIVNMEEVVKKLSAVKEKFDLPFVLFAIPDELTYVFSVSVPVPEKGDITEEISFVMEENVPLSLSEVVFDFEPVKIVPGDEDQVFTVVVASAAKEIEKFTEAFHKAGLEPVGCVHESQAMTRAVVPQRMRGTFYIVHARENRVGIHLVKNNLIHFSTIRNISGDYKKEFLDEYEKFKEYCLKYDPDKGQTESVLVCGDFEFAKKAVEFLFDYKDRPKDARLGNVWTNIFDLDKYLPEIPYEKSLGLAGAVGAALADII